MLVQKRAIVLISLPYNKDIQAEIHGKNSLAHSYWPPNSNTTLQKMSLRGTQSPTLSNPESSGHFFSATMYLVNQTFTT